MKYPNSKFLNAVKATTPERGQIDRIAKLIGCSSGTAIKRLRKLETAGEVKVTKRKTYDPQPHRDAWGSSLFGGAGSCVRRYLTVEIIHLTRNGH